MHISKHLNDALLIILTLLCLSGSHFFSSKNEKPRMSVTKQQSSFNIDDKFWSLFHLGQKRFISSLYWISTIIESDHDHYKGKDLNSWMFLRFRTISILEPKFYETYNFGGLYLSIIKDDLEGASYLYNKGIEIYPSDINLLKNASFHFYFEVQDYKSSYFVLKKLQAIPNVNPMLLSSLARIESQNGNLEDAFAILNESYMNLKTRNEFLSQKIFSQLYAIRAEIDIKCLNSGNSRCRRIDLEGKYYTKGVDGKYKALREWSPYRIREKRKNDPPL